MELDWLDNDIRLNSSKLFPIVLTRLEMNKVLDKLDGVCQLIVSLLYGSGLRLCECLQLSVRDIDFENRLIMIRNDADQVQKVALLPDELIPKLKNYLKKVKLVFSTDIQITQVDKKRKPTDSSDTRKEHNDWQWQYLFPEPETPLVDNADDLNRKHIDARRLNVAVTRAVKQAGIKKPISCHMFRHCFAELRLSQGDCVQTVQELLGHTVPTNLDKDRPGSLIENIKDINPLSLLNEH